MASSQTIYWKPPALSTIRQGQLPVDIFRKFKKELGEVNSHLCLIDAAIQDLSHAHRRSKDKAAFLQQRTREHGHRRLATDNLNLEFAMRLAYTSQIALLLSRLEQLCRVLQKHSLINKQFNDFMEGDFLRRTLWLVASTRRGEKLPTPILDEVTFTYLDSLDVTIFDYYRTMRNLELHSVSDGNLSEAHSKINTQRCTSEFSYVPKLQGELGFSDVLLVSKICQRLARSLCRSISDPQRDIIPELKRRFGNLDKDRRLCAAKALMTQSYLLDISDVETILYDLAW